MPDGAVPPQGRLAERSSVRRVLAAALVIIGISWTFVSAGRGPKAVAHWTAASRVDQAKVAFAWDTCVQSAINRSVPYGATVWIAPHASLYWSYSLGSLSAPRHQVVKDFRAGAYSIRVVPAGARADEGVVCSGHPHRHDADVVLEVKKP